MPATKSIAELSADNAVLISALSAMHPGDIATYEQHFTQWLGKPIRNRADLSSFDTVIKALLRDHGMVLSVIHGVGYKLLTEQENLKNDSKMRRIRHTNARRKKELAVVDISHFSELERLEWVAKVTQSHLIAETSGDKALKKLTHAANGATQPLALAKALDAIKGSV